MKQEPLNVVKVALWCYSMKKKDANAGSLHGIIIKENCVKPNCQI